MSDLDEIGAHYAERASDPRLQSLYGPTSTGDRFLAYRRDTAIIDLLQALGRFPLHDKRILDVGCGDGHTLRRFVDMGADPVNCFGVDVNSQRLAKARYRNAHMTFLESSAAGTPWESGSFDIITQLTAFSSMPSENMRQDCAREMQRLLRPSGLILWYDFRVRHPRNPHVQAMRARDIRGLFSGWDVELHSLTLAPPIARRLVGYSEIACILLEKLPPLRTHYLAAIRCSSGVPA